MRFAAAALRERGVRRRPRSASRWSATCSARVGHCGHCQLGPLFVCKDGPVLRATTRVAPAPRGAGAVSAGRKPTLAVWKFASCDGCQLIAARLRGRAAAARRRGRDRLLPGGAARDRSTGPTTSRSSRARSPPPHDAERIREIRARSRALVTIGACATAGGIQALRNFADVDDFVVGRLRAARVHLDARDLDADPRARAGRLRAAGLPDRQAPAARGHQRLPATSAGRDRRRTASASSASGAATSA